MAGYTDSAFRILCRQYGADVTVTELISADAIFHHAKHWFLNEKGSWESKKGYDETLEMLQFDERERPIVIQLFGKFPEKFGFAASWITKNLKPDGIDINMGCPARKVVNSDHGAALLKNPELAVEIVEAVKSNTNLPVSVKTRLGWSDDDEILAFAPKLVSAGIDALIIHGRTYKDGFKGKARWENIFKVKSMLPDLCVIGNGDLTSISNFQGNNDLSGKHGQISLDGIAIGRATFGKPWLFSREYVSMEELREVILAHAKLTFEKKGEKGIIEFRKHLLAYLKGFPKAKELRQKAVMAKNLHDIEEIISELSS